MSSSTIPPAGPAGQARPEQIAQALRVGALLLLNLAFVTAFAQFGKRFEAPSGPSVGDLELAFTAGSFQQILLIWAKVHDTGISAFRWSVVLLDTFFPFAYALFLSRLYVWVVETGGGRTLTIGRVAPWVAAVLDFFVENVLLVVLTWGLHDKAGIERATFSPGAVFTMSTAAALKLALLVLTLVLTLVALFQGPRGRVLALCRFSALSVVLGSVPLLAVPQGRDLLVALGNEAEWPGRFAFFAFLVVWTLSVWYWARVLVTLRSEDAPPTTEDELFFVAWTPRILGLLTPGLAALAFLRAAGMAERAWVMVFLGVICLGLAGAFLVFTLRRRRRLEKRGEVRATADAAPGPQMPARADATRSVKGLPSSVRRVIAVSLAASLALFAAFTIWPLVVPARLGAITVLIVAAANTVFFGSVAILAGRRFHLPVVTVGLVAAAAFSLWNDNHDIRLVPGTEAKVKGRPLLADAFRDWFEPLQKGCTDCSNGVPVYLVAAEGGGIRAAYWTAGVLAHAQDRDRTFARHLFAISGVSGGSLGAGVFASLVKDSMGGPLECSGRGPASSPIENCTREILAGRFLTPTLAKMVTGDVLQQFWPIPVRFFDRGQALEDSWDASYEEATHQRTLARGYLEAWPSASAGLPALLLNSSYVEGGQRVIATPFQWSGMGRDPSAAQPIRKDAEFPDAYDMLGVLGTDLPLHTAMHNSARFTYVSPAGRLRPYGQDRGRVVDGGYFENSGAVTLLNLLRALSALPLSAPSPRFIVIYVCNSPERCHLPPTEPAGDAAWRPAEGLDDVASPLRALLSAREARGSLALAELRREPLVGRFVEFGICKDRLEHPERAESLPLGWQLSDGVRKELDQQVGWPDCGTVAIP